MKVAFYIGSLNRGGAETLLADILSQEELPFDAVCVYRREGSLSDAFQNSCYPLLHLPKKRSWILYLYRLRRLLKKERVDVIHAQTSLNAIIAILCTSFTGIRLVNTFHGFSFSSAPKILRRFVFKGCDRLVFVSQYEKDYYLSKGDFCEADKCRVVYNGISFEKFGVIPQMYYAERPLELCMVGSFGEGRNHLFVCRSLDRLRERGIPFRFSFIGAARESERLVYDRCVSYCEEKGLTDQVHFLGLSNDVPHLLLTMDGFVYATRHDSFGIAVIEAIASGLPTFVNDWRVMDEITDHGEYANLYMTDNIESLVDKIADYAEHRQQYIEKAHVAALSVRKKYSIGQHIASLYQQYCEII